MLKQTLQASHSTSFQVDMISYPWATWESHAIYAKDIEMNSIDLACLLVQLLSLEKRIATCFKTSYLTAELLPKCSISFSSSAYGDYFLFMAMTHQLEE